MATKFRFRLETLRKLRERSRDVHRMHVAKAAEKIRAVEQRMENLNGQLAETIDESRGTRGSVGVDIATLRSQQYFCSVVHRQFLECDQERARSRAELGAARERLVNASRQLKTVERLRERQWTRHQVQAARQDRLTEDEIATHSFRRSVALPAREDVA